MRGERIAFRDVEGLNPKRPLLQRPLGMLEVLMLSLIVDDDEATRSYIESILRSENFETLEAEDGEQGVEIVRMLDGAVDLIVSDIRMPGGDGITFAKAVRAAFPFVPIILVSGSDNPHPDFDFVEKPFSWDMLVRVIRRVLPKAAA